MEDSFGGSSHLVSAWKAKCPIFKAIVAGFRGPKLPKKIGHLAFQVVNNHGSDVP